MTASSSEARGLGRALAPASRATLEDAGKLVLRVLVGALMLFHGLDKLLRGLGHVREDLVRAGLPEALAFGSYVGEVVAPVLIIIGLWTRPAALIYAATTVFAISIVHAEDFGRLEPTGAWAAELWMFYIVTPAVVALLGAGRYSLRRGRGAWD